MARIWENSGLLHASEWGKARSASGLLCTPEVLAQN